MGNKPPREDRLRQFFSTLTEKNIRFDNPIEAHRYLNTSLREIECKYSNGMFMFNLDFFKFIEKHRLYFYSTPCHFIIIHLNGSYGIYKKQCPSEVEFTAELYSTNPTFCLVHIKNVKGKNLWNKK